VTRSLYALDVEDPRETLPEQDLDCRAPQKTVPHLELALECEDADLLLARLHLDVDDACEVVGVEPSVYDEGHASWFALRP